jgi:hypothetical protein
MIAEEDRRQYRHLSGDLQWVPSIGLVREMSEYGQGFCLACGEVQACVEPDAVCYTCDCCGASKVFGSSELALRGLTF